MPEKIKLPLYGQLKEHVSFSELGQFNDCQWKWVLNKIFEFERPDRSLALEFGHAVHAGMEFLYADPDNIRSVEETAAKALQAFADEVKGAVLTEDEEVQYEQLKELLPSIFRDALACPDLQGIRPVKNELRLYGDIERTDGLKLKFKGFIDFIFVKKLKKKSVLYIADFKTCKWGWPAAKFQEIRVIAQILLYKHFFCKLTGADPKNVTCAYILLKKEPRKDSPSVEVCKIGSGPKATENAIKYLQDTITKMHSYEYEKNWESCKTVWTDKKTGKQMGFQCPFLGHECAGPPVSEESVAGS